jgi:hypothetical protein
LVVPSMFAAALNRVAMAEKQTLQLDERVPELERRIGRIEQALSGPNARSVGVAIRDSARL